MIRCGNSLYLPLMLSLSFAITVCEILKKKASMESKRKSVLYSVEAPLENEWLFLNLVGSPELYFVVNI